MPMLDLHIPAGALHEARERELVQRVTDILIRHEGFDPDDPVTQSVSWAFVHRPEMYVGGKPAAEPRYKIVASVPEGQLTDESRASVVAQVTEAVLDAEDGRWPRDPGRVWVFPTDVPEGRWGGRGGIVGLAGILARLTGGDTEAANELADQRIAAARRTAELTSPPRNDHLNTERRRGLGEASGAASHSRLSDPRTTQGRRVSEPGHSHRDAVDGMRDRSS